MKRILHFIMIGSFAMAISACSRPPVPEGDLTPPPSKAYDAKTQLETGRTR
jgi:hypothetical protein